MLRFFRIITVLSAIQALTALSAHAFNADPLPDPEPPFVVCKNQTYALCAEAECFVYDGVAYCKCDINTGDSISLQLSYSTIAGTRNVCSVNQQGKANGYMISTFSLPKNAKKGGTYAAYTCPGADDAGGGVVAPVAYGQCDGGFCFKSTPGKKIPGFTGRLQNNEILCSCPISTEATAGSSDPLGYQLFGPYHPNAALGSRCDASTCNACSVPNPTDNGASFHVGAPTGSGKFLALRLNGPPVPALNECLCSCQPSGPNGAIVCTAGEDQTP